MRDLYELRNSVHCQRKATSNYSISKGGMAGSSDFFGEGVSYLT